MTSYFLVDTVNMSPAEVKKLRAFVAAKASGATGVANVPKQSVQLFKDGTVVTSI